MSVTRRSFLISSGVVSTALIVRPPSIPAPPEEVLEAEIIEDLDVVTPRPMTRLELFLKSRGIKPAHLARESGYSRQHLLRLRMGRMEPTRKCIASLVVACRRLTRAKVRAADLFDLEAV